MATASKERVISEDARDIWEVKKTKTFRCLGDWD